MLLEDLEIDAAAFAAGTGWKVEPRGACRAEICVPLGGADGDFDLPDVAARLGMALIHDEQAGLWALGPDTVGGRALGSAQAPDLVLPDLDGTHFALSSLRGQKVLLVAWAPY
ncbi:MAG: hypothetical protein RIE08_11020 [Acidimicrobiales bacterium]